MKNKNVGYLSTFTVLVMVCWCPLFGEKEKRKSHQQSIIIHLTVSTSQIWFQQLLTVPHWQADVVNCCSPTCPATLETVMAMCKFRCWADWRWSSCLCCLWQKKWTGNKLLTPKMRRNKFDAKNRHTNDWISGRESSEYVCWGPCGNKPRVQFSVVSCATVCWICSRLLCYYHKF